MSEQAAHVIQIYLTNALIITVCLAVAEVLLGETG